MGLTQILEVPDQQHEHLDRIVVPKIIQCILKEREDSAAILQKKIQFEDCGGTSKIDQPNVICASKHPTSTVRDKPGNSEVVTTAWVFGVPVSSKVGFGKKKNMLRSPSMIVFFCNVSKKTGSLSS